MGGVYVVITCDVIPTQRVSLTTATTTTVTAVGASLEQVPG